MDKRTVLSRYGITDAFPESWPAEKDGSDDSDSGMPSQAAKVAAQKARGRQKSRYTILETGRGDRRALVPGAELTRDGVENLVQKDEPDPLGIHQKSVLEALRRQGVDVEGDEALRNQFLLSSTTFNPTLFLARVHAESQSSMLKGGLDYINRSIDQKSASLKVLVESNFERFVKAKKTIDDVYTEMRNQGKEEEGLQPEGDRFKRHSRNTSSRSSNHFRHGSGGNRMSSLQPLPNEKRKHALTKEAEYGTMGIKSPLMDVAVKAEEVWGPQLSGKERAKKLRSFMAAAERDQEIMELPNEIQQSIKRKDNDKLVADYTKARNLLYESRAVADNAKASGSAISDDDIQRMILVSRVWENIEEQVEIFKRGVWRDLTSVEAHLAMSTDSGHQEDHLALIGVLLALGVEDNPIWLWLLSRYDYLKNKINSTFERSRVEIEVYRRRLANGSKPTLFAQASHFRSPSRSNPEEVIKHIDSQPILEMWEVVLQVMKSLLAVQGGILGEVLDFWEKSQSFIDGKTQKTLPTGIDGTSQEHHRLSADGINELQKGVVEIVELLRDHIMSFFIDPPVEDVSMLFSPLPAESPNTPRSANLSVFPKPEMRLNTDLLTPPPPSPRNNEPWEGYAFWPPWANSLSGVHYLSKLLVLVATAAAEMASIRPVATEGMQAEKLKNLVNAVRERSAKAVCSAWHADSASFKVLEDWTRGAEGKDATRWPASFAKLEGFILSGTQKILYIPESGGSKRGPANVITAPSTTLLGLTRRQFVDSILRALTDMVSNAEKPINSTQNPWSMNKVASILEGLGSVTHEGSRDAVDASTTNLRVLLTLSNVAALRATTIPALISQFETDFSVTLVDESAKITEFLTELDSRLFALYVRPKDKSLSATIHAGIASPSWPPSTQRPTQVRQYLYDALLALVHVHSEASTATPSLVPRVLSHLLESASDALLDALKQRGRFPLPSLMQATLDVEFFMQTLDQFKTKRSGDLQSSMYQVLDSGTDNTARGRLKTELPEMRAVLKKLREGTRGEFECFRKPRPERTK